MATDAPLGAPRAPAFDEVAAFARDWYRRLDEHAPAADVVAMVADPGVEFRLPEGVRSGPAEFRRWYEGVIATFFDEVHAIRRLAVTHADDSGAAVDVIVNWQARRWRAPAPRSEWIGFDAFQRWTVARAPSGRLVIARYAVDELRPMPGSPPL
jgi:hypothetical protein